jgi:AraC-like DNA-binding protein
MTALASTDLHLRSYGDIRQGDRHDFAQLVLPVSGAVLLEIEGRQARLDPLQGAFVAPQSWHSQCSDRPHRSLLLDIAPHATTPETWARLHDRPFTALAPAARKLIEFMGIMVDQRNARPAVIHGWVPLLLDTLTLSAPQPASRLAALLSCMQAEPGLPWTTERMAQRAGLSVSRLHALFRSELDSSPHAWLLECRLQQARDWLASTNRPIADIALNAGFSDQSALTRAMRDAGRPTPAAYRRQSRENKPKTQ